MICNECETVAHCTSHGCIPKTTKKDEAMKLALEALEAGEYYIDDLEAIVYASDDIGTHEDRAKMQAAITALREALAQERSSDEQPAQQQEPVKVGRITGNIKEMVLRQEVMLYTDDYLPIGTALYTSPPAQRKPLTDERIEEIRTEQEFDWWGISEGAFKYAARAIEAAHGIKGDA